MLTYKKVVALMVICSVTVLASAICVKLDQNKMNKQTSILLNEIRIDRAKTFNLDTKSKQYAPNVVYRVQQPPVPTRGGSEEKEALEHAAKMIQVNGGEEK